MKKEIKKAAYDIADRIEGRLLTKFKIERELIKQLTELCKKYHAEKCQTAK